MSHHIGLDEDVVTTQLELLDESSFHLQSSVCDFAHQMKTSAMECIENTSGSNMTVKDNVVAMVKTAQSTIKEHADLITEPTKLYPPKLLLGQKTTSESRVLKPTSDETLPVDSNYEIIRRLKEIETALSSLQDTTQKTEDDISEIKQWRDNFVTEQSDLGIKIEKLMRKQTHNFKNLRKQIIEQDNKIEELNQQIDRLNTKESDTDKTLEKLSLDMKEYDNNLHTLNKEMRVYTDKTDHVTQEIKRHSDLISAIQEDTTKTFDTLLSKNVVICKFLQQRLMPIEKIITIHNKNKETGKGQLKKIDSLEAGVLKLKLDFHTTANQLVEHSNLGFIASQGRWNRKMNDEYKLIFKTVERNAGNHFDPKTGEFTAPVDGLYKASLTIKHTGDHAVRAWLKHRFDDMVLSLGDVETTYKSVEASRIFEVRMKSGDVLFSITGFVDCECTRFSCSFLVV